MNALAPNCMAVGHDVPSSASSLLDWASERFDLQMSAPIDVDRIADLLGIRVVDKIFNKNPEIVGQIFFTDDKKPVVELNIAQNTYEPRRRFTLAHEIGHYCLHARRSELRFIDTKEKMSRSESYWDAHESQANSFAAMLLMPKSLIISEGKAILEDSKNRNESGENVDAARFIDLMARKFNVSNVSMEYRLRNLGIISG